MANENIVDKYSSIRLKNQLCFPLYACAKEIVRLYRKPLEKLGLTYTQYVVMMVFWEHGGMIEKELGKIVHLDSGTLAPLLRRLEKQGEKLKKEALHVPEEMSGCIYGDTCQACTRKHSHRKRYRKTLFFILKTSVIIRFL